MKQLRGFTLVELIIYFTIITTILLASVTLSIEFAAFRDQGREEQALLENATLIDQKFKSALFGINDSMITIPSAGTSGNSLSITTPNDVLTFDVLNGALRLNRQSVGQTTPLTNSHVTVSNFLVERSTINGSPALTLSFDLTNRVHPTETFRTIYYPINL